MRSLDRELLFCLLLDDVSRSDIFFFFLNLRYVDQFSRCLHVEYKKSGIDVQCQVNHCCFVLLRLCSSEWS